MKKIFQEIILNICAVLTVLLCKINVLIVLKKIKEDIRVIEVISNLNMISWKIMYDQSLHIKKMTLIISKML